MNNQEFNTSKPASEQESQALSSATESETESSETGFESRQRSSSSEPDNCDLPSFSSPEYESSTTGSDTYETSSEDKPEFDSPEFTSLSLIGTTLRLITLAAMIYADGQDAKTRFLAMSSCRGSEQQLPVIEWEDTNIGRCLLDRFWDRVRNVSANMSLSHTLVITDDEQNFLEEFIRCVPYEIPAAIQNTLGLPPLTFTGPLPEIENPSFMRLPSGRSIAALEMALAHISVRRSVAQILSREIPGTSGSDPNSELWGDLLPILKLVEPREYFSALENTLRDDSLHESPREAQSSEMKNADDTTVVGNSRAPETLDHESANSLEETSNVAPEESLEELPEGTPAKKSKNQDQLEGSRRL